MVCALHLALNFIFLCLQEEDDHRRAIRRVVIHSERSKVKTNKNKQNCCRSRNNSSTAQQLSWLNTVMTLLLQNMLYIVWIICREAKFEWPMFHEHEIGKYALLRSTVYSMNGGVDDMSITEIVPE